MCISATIINDLERLTRDYKDFREKIANFRIPILFGGRVLEDKNTRNPSKSELYVRSFTDVAELARKLKFPYIFEKLLVGKK